MARYKISFLMQSRVIFDEDEEGKRFTGGKVHWGRWKSWNNYEDNADNLREAVKCVTEAMRRYHIGANVYVRTLLGGRLTKKVVRLYQAKWGHDNKPFTQFDGIAGYWWKRRVEL